jgi:hypothetical protein
VRTERRDGPIVGRREMGERETWSERGSHISAGQAVWREPVGCWNYVQRVVGGLGWAGRRVGLCGWIMEAPHVGEDALDVDGFGFFCDDDMGFLYPRFCLALRCISGGEECGGCLVLFCFLT